MATNKINPQALAILILVAALMAVSAALVMGRVGENQNGLNQQVEQQVQGKVHRWKLVTTWPKGFPGLGVGPENFAKWVAAMSDGRLLIEVYGAGEIVPPFEVFDAVSQNTAQVGHGASYYWKGKVPSSVFFTSMPFGLTAQEINAWFYHGGGLDLWRKAYAPFSLVPFPGGNTGMQMAGWYNREINTVSDLKGLKMRIPGLAGEVFTRAGGTAVTLPGGELFTSMQTGVIDAVEWVGPYNDTALGFHKVAKYLYYPGWQEPGAALEFIVNKEAWDALPEDLQQIVDMATRVVNQDMLAEYTAANNRALQDLIHKHNVQLREMPDDVLIELHKVTEQIIEEQSAADPLFAEVYESYIQFRSGVRGYHKISEQAIMAARDRVEAAAQQRRQ